MMRSGLNLSGVFVLSSRLSRYVFSLVSARLQRTIEAYEAPVSKGPNVRAYKRQIPKKQKKSHREQS